MTAAPPDIPTAIGELRNKLGWTQQALADELGIRVNSISRNETGQRAPSQKTLKALASLAKAQGFKRLAATFERQRKEEIGSVKASLRSSGTQRRVAFADLESWRNFLLDSIGQSAEAAITKLESSPRLTPEQLVAIAADIRAIAGVATFIASEINLYL